MAVTAKFIADFSSFQSAVEKAQVQLKSFETGAGKVEGALGRMTDGFSGRKVVQEAALMVKAIDAAGGASVLTGKELASVGAKAAEAAEKMQRLGIDVPPGLQKLAAAATQVDHASTGAAKAGGLLSTTFAQVLGALSVSSLINRAASALTGLAKEALATAGTLVDLSHKTGLSTETIQRMQFVAKQSGTDMEAFSGAAFKMGVNVSEGTKKAREGAESLGLSWAALRAASPDDQFTMVVQALERMEDPQQRNTAAVALFGKTAQDILPAIVDGYSKVASEATVAGDAQVKALDAAGDAWDRFKTRTTSSFIGAAGSVLLLREAVATLSQEERDYIQHTDKSIKTTDDFSAALIRALQAKKNAKDVALVPDQKSPFPESFTADLKAAEAGYRALTAAQREELQAALRLGKSNEDIINQLNISEGVLSRAKNAHQASESAVKKHAAEAEKLADAWKEYGSTAGNVHKQLSGNTIEGIKFDLARGQSQATLAKVYGVTATQIKAIADEMESLKKFEAMKFEGLKGIENLGIQMAPLNDIMGAALIKMHDFAFATNDAAGAIAKLGIQIKPSMDDFKKTVTSSFADSFKQLPTLLIQGFTGGGNIKGALQGLSTTISEGLFGGIGKDAGPLAGLTKGLSGVVTKATGFLGESVSGLMGKVVSGFLPGIGALVGPLLSGIKKLFGGPSADELAGRDIKKTFQDSFGGFDQMLGTIAKAYEETGRTAQMARQDVERLMAAEKDGAEAVKKVMAEINVAFEQQKKQWQGVQDSVGALNAFTESGIDTAGKFGLAGASAVAIFAEWVLKTGDVIGALNQIGPTLDALAESQKTLGIEGDASIQKLLGLREVTEANKPLMENIAQSTALLTALGTAGLLTNETIVAFGQNAVNQFAMLSGETGNAKTAMMLMQPELQKLWEHQEKFGEFADEATQALIDQAREAGLVGPDMKSDQDKLLGVMKEIRDTLLTIAGITIPDKTFRVTPQIEPIEVPESYSRAANDNYGSMGGRVTAEGIQHFAGGGRVLAFRPRGTDTVPAMLTPGETVRTVAQEAALGAGTTAIVDAIHELQQTVSRLPTADENALSTRDAFLQSGRRFA